MKVQIAALLQVQETVGGTTYFFPASASQDPTVQDQQQQQLAANSRSTLVSVYFVLSAFSFFFCETCVT